jgi:hypothetical protein
MLMLDFAALFIGPFADSAVAGADSASPECPPTISKFGFEISAT